MCTPPPTDAQKLDCCQTPIVPPATDLHAHTVLYHICPDVDLHIGCAEYVSRNGRNDGVDARMPQGNLITLTKQSGVNVKLYFLVKLRWWLA